MSHPEPTAYLRSDWADTQSLDHLPTFRDILPLINLLFAHGVEETSTQTSVEQTIVALCNLAQSHFRAILESLQFYTLAVLRGWAALWINFPPDTFLGASNITNQHCMVIQVAFNSLPFFSFQRTALF